MHALAASHASATAIATVLRRWLRCPAHTHTHLSRAHSMCCCSCRRSCRRRLRCRRHRCTQVARQLPEPCQGGGRRPRGARLRRPHLQPHCRRRQLRAPGRRRRGVQSAQREAAGHAADLQPAVPRRRVAQRECTASQGCSAVRVWARLCALRLCVSPTAHAGPQHAACLAAPLATATPPVLPAGRGLAVQGGVWAQAQRQHRRPRRAVQLWRLAQRDGALPWALAADAPPRQRLWGAAPPARGWALHAAAARTHAMRHCA